MEYTAYSSEDVYMKTIVVSGGGMDCSGATHAEVQVIYKDKDMTEIKAVYYEEFGKNPLRKYIGDDIEWGEDDNFKVEEEEEEDVLVALKRLELGCPPGAGMAVLDELAAAYLHNSKKKDEEEEEEVSEC